MNKKNKLGQRMKENYENRAKTSLLRRTPVFIRIDGRAFHTFTKGFNRPFDKNLSNAMDLTTIELCKNIQGCVLGYTQSDEITLLLNDYETLDACAWFDYDVQKLCSICASMTTLYFNRAFESVVTQLNGSLLIGDEQIGAEAVKTIQSYNKSMSQGAMFDARCFNVPREEVLNCILWRVKDCIKNSAFTYARAHFPHSRLQGKDSSTMKEMVLNEHGKDWAEDLAVRDKYGTFVVKDNGSFDIVNTPIESYSDLDKFIKVFNVPI